MKGHRGMAKVSVVSTKCLKGIKQTPTHSTWACCVSLSSEHTPCKSQYLFAYNFRRLLFLFIVFLERWTGVKELTKTPLMQANSKVLFPPTRLHPGSLHFNTLLKLQITIFLATQTLILRNYFSRDSNWHLQDLAARIRMFGVLFIIAISCI